MRNEIVEYFKTDRSFNAGVALYMKHGKNMAFKNTLNRQGTSEYNVRLLNAELGKLAGLSNEELKGMLSVPVSKAAPVAKSEEAKAGSDTDETLPAIAAEEVTKIPEEVKPEGPAPVVAKKKPQPKPRRR